METRFSVPGSSLAIEERVWLRETSYIAAVLCPVQSIGFNSSFNLVCILLFTYRVGVGGGSARCLRCSSQLAIKEGDS